MPAPATSPVNDTIAFLDDTFTALERAAWQLRGMADGATALWRDADQARRRSARLAAAGLAVGRIVADYRFHAVIAPFRSAGSRAEALERVHARSARRFREACTRRRGGFVKVGQMISARPDLLPAAWVRELAGLQDDVPAEPFETVRAVIEADLGAPLARLFRDFDEQPVAAASIGQVHRAVTPAGQVVAVKVQRPGIAELIGLDLALLEASLEALGGLIPPCDQATIVAEVRDAVGLELDYAREAAAMERVGADLAAMPGVIVPRPLRPLCGARVLTSSFVEGRRLTAALEDAAAAARGALLGRLLEAYVRQILVHGFYQADPHPGNFLVTPAGDLALLDFGCSRELTPAARRGYGALVRDFVAGDRGAVGAGLAALGFATRSGGPRTLERFAEALLDRFREAAAGSVAWPSRDDFLVETAGLLAVAQEDPILRIPADFVMIGRVFGTLGGLFLHHRPEIDWINRVAPFLFD